MENILELKHISKKFHPEKKLFNKMRKHSHTVALDDVSVSVKKGEICGLIGESGCGKTTMSNIILKLIPPDEGKIFFDGQDITDLHTYKDLLPIRRQIQGVFQNSGTSLNPYMTVEKIITEPLDNFGEPKDGVVEKLLEHVGLPMDIIKRKPMQLSGGQRQRVSIARALALKPKLIVLDEPTSNLDVITTKEIMKLLKHLNNEHNISMIFISHDLSLVNKVCDRKMIMLQGKIVETIKDYRREEAKHPYTVKLFEANISLDKKEEENLC